ncbi:ABC transporter substrate-binding protein [Lysinibacter cavernae]|uniref:Multiple sugar transport system substrate-binding protein n=1 Tax=Lysinibacter cavernae TaxID=1640652 RepID=A0A7X5TT27_9MICO|nr:multiple sugar transport system substrate-binding protein [Lysinibacter cavernae]
MKHTAILRATGVSAAAFLLAGSLVSCSGSEGGDSESKVLRVTLANHVWTDIVKDAIPEFEEETGYTVELTQLGEDQLSDQYNVKLNAGTGDIDVMMYRPQQETKLFAQNGYFADLTDKVTENSDWNWDDFQEGPVSLVTADEQVVGVPIITEREVLYYRKDLLEAAGLEVPKTIDELEAAAKQISETTDVAGFVARTGRAAAVTQFSSFLASYGGEFIDEDGNSAVGTDEAKEAYAMYGNLIHNYGPENVSTDMSWPEAMAIFTQGNAAFYTEADSLYKNATEEANSSVADSVGFAQFPAGPAGSKPYNVAAWALGVNSESGNQDAAWQFIEWATSKEKVLEIQQAGVPGPRESVWDDPAGTESFPADLAEAMAASSKVGVGFDRPLVINVAEAREIVGNPIVVGITGGDTDAAADEANDKFQAFLEDEQ